MGDDGGLGAAFFVGVVFGFVVGAFVAFMVLDASWQKAAVKHGAAVYVTIDGESVWKWNDEAEAEEPTP